MKRINFENLPSTKTPITAENLNTLQDNMEAVGVEISNKAPYATKSKVWIQDKEELFVTSAITENVYIDSTGQEVESTSTNTSDYILLEAYNDYLFTYNYDELASTSERNVAYYDMNKNFIRIESYSPETYDKYYESYAAMGNNEYYIRISYDKNCKNISFAKLVNKMYVKNFSGRFDEFKNNKINIVTGKDFKTGRKRNGKEEYGREINFGTLPNNGSKQVPTGLSDVTYTGFDAVAIATNGTLVTLPFVTPSSLNANIGISINSDNIIIDVGKDRSNFTATVTVYYTIN